MTTRRFVTSGVAASALALVMPADLLAASNLRTEFRSTTADGKRNRASLIRGWGIMKNRRRIDDPWNDAFSIDFLVWFHNLRGVHSGYHFIDWHTGFVWWFEQAIRVLSGDAQFALPYLDLSTMPGRVLPAEFRDTNSPLYHPRRDPAINAGGAYPLSAVEWENTVRIVPFTTSDGTPNFGGPPGPPQTETGAIQGGLQSQPHGPIHIATGGDMPNLATSPWDILFFMLHGWVQMLTRFWRSRGGEYPEGDPNWINLSPSFRFPDANGNPVNKTIPQILTADFQQRYEKWPVFTTAAKATAALRMQSQPSRTKPELLAMESGIDLPSQSSMRTVSLAHSARSGRILLTLIGITCSPNAYHEVYVNPASMAPTASDPSFVGNIAVLRHNKTCSGPGQVFDITEQVGALSKIRLLLVAQPTRAQTGPIGVIQTLEVHG